VSETLRHGLTAIEALLRRSVHFRTEAELVAVVLRVVHAYALVVRRLWRVVKKPSANEIAALVVLAEKKTHRPRREGRPA
jgi:hypothetical protein